VLVISACQISGSEVSYINKQIENGTPTDSILEPMAAPEQELKSGANDPIEFNDPNFKTALLEALGKNPHEDITCAEAAEVTSLYISGKEIKDITEIKHFTALTKLDCSSNRLAFLDVSQCFALELLHCDRNNLTHLDLGKNAAIKYLCCQYNQITSLDASPCVGLEYLDCSSNKLTSLNIYKCSSLETMLIYHNNDIRGLEEFKKLPLRELIYSEDNANYSIISGENKTLTITCIGGIAYGDLLSGNFVNEFITLYPEDGYELYSNDKSYSLEYRDAIGLNVLDIMLNTDSAYYEHDAFVEPSADTMSITFEFTKREPF
jgi:hypothetical protein